MDRCLDGATLGAAVGLVPALLHGLVLVWPAVRVEWLETEEHQDYLIAWQDAGDPGGHLALIVQRDPQGLGWVAVSEGRVSHTVARGMGAADVVDKVCSLARWLGAKMLQPLGA